MVDHFVEMFQELYDDVDGLSSSRHNGSSKKKWGNKKRERAIGHAKLKRAYFTPPPARYPHDRFKRRFYKHRSLFTHIMIVVCEQDVHFTQGNDVANQSSLSKEHKCTSTIRMFGIAYNFLHNYCCMGGPTTYESIKMFCIVVRECFEFEYSRQPITCANILRQININKSIGWLGKFASLDCMHPKVKKMSYFSGMSICEQNE